MNFEILGKKRNPEIIRLILFESLRALFNLMFEVIYWLATNIKDGKKPKFLFCSKSEIKKWEKTQYNIKYQRRILKMFPSLNYHLNERALTLLTLGCPRYPPNPEPYPKRFLQRLGSTLKFWVGLFFLSALQWCSLGFREGVAKTSWL